MMHPHGNKYQLVRRQELTINRDLNPVISCNYLTDFTNKLQLSSKLRRGNVW